MYLSGNINKDNIEFPWDSGVKIISSRHDKLTTTEGQMSLCARCYKLANMTTEDVCHWPGHVRKSLKCISTTSKQN